MTAMQVGGESINDRQTNKRKLITMILIVCLVVCCIAPMGISSYWNGEQPAHRNQYELMAEAILDGRLYIEYNEPEHIEKLMQLENPYDPAQREASGVKFHWDHSLYNGRYYMYFGVVPVFLLFLPYRLLTGSSLTTYHATQVFTAFVVLGIFALFDLLRRRFFRKMPYWTYVFLASAFSVITVRYSISAPSLYCTAINSALAFQIWSYYFFIKAVWVTTDENKQLRQAAWGALMGALVFGCRPTIAIGNLLVVPMLIVFLRQRKFTAGLLGKLAIAASPYIVMAIFLMTYNYVRFDNPFEFGQSYQLTLYDIQEYAANMTPGKLLASLWQKSSFWFGPIQLQSNFPFLSSSGIFCSYPIFIMLATMFRPSVWKMLRKEKLASTVIFINVAIVIISVLEVWWSAMLVPRYQMDIYFLLAILCFIIVGIQFCNYTEKQGKVWSGVLIGCAVVCLALDVIYYLDDLALYKPDLVEKIGSVLFG